MNVNGWKTYLTAAAGILAAVVGYLNGAIDMPHLVEAIFAALSVINLRHSVTTETKKNA